MGPSCLSIVTAQLIALLYWPDPEFMNLVLTTSTGEATTVVQKPAPKAAVKWHGRLSVVEQKLSHILTHYFLYVFRCVRIWTKFARRTCHQVILQDELFDHVICHQLCAVYNGITGDVGHATCKKGEGGLQNNIGS